MAMPACSRALVFSAAGAGFAKNLFDTWDFLSYVPIYSKQTLTNKREESSMSASEKFLRFAAECETMASLARDRESRLVWRDFANRWNRYAQSVEFRLAKAQIDRIKRPHRRPALDSSSSGDAVLLTP
jgi:hypothetical protein